jgi:hypothetical protein
MSVKLDAEYVAGVRKFVDEYLVLNRHLMADPEKASEILHWLEMSLGYGYQAYLAKRDAETNDKKV